MGGEDEEYGGDIASGFGDSTLHGPVSDEKAEQMLHGAGGTPPGDAGGAEPREEPEPGGDYQV